MHNRSNIIDPNLLQLLIFKMNIGQASFNELKLIIDWAATNHQDEFLLRAFNLALELDVKPSHGILINSTITKLGAANNIHLAWEIYSFAVKQGWADFITCTTLIRQASISTEDKRVVLEYAELAYEEAKKKGQINAQTHDTMLLAKGNLEGLNSAMLFFNDLDEEGLLNSVTFSTMISICQNHSQMQLAHAFYKQAINTDAVTDPELHAAMAKAASITNRQDLVMTVYEIAAKNGAVNDSHGTILKEYSKACRNLGDTGIPLSESKHEAQNWSGLNRSPLPSTTSHTQTKSVVSENSFFSSEFFGDDVDVNSSVSQQLSVHSYTPAIPASEFERKINAYKSNAQALSFAVHNSMIEDAARNNRSDIVKLALDYALAIDRSDKMYLFNHAMSATSRDIHLCWYVYQKSIEVGAANIATHTYMVKLAGQSANLDYAFQAYTNALAPLKPGQKKPAAPIKTLPANVIHNTMIIAMGNCKRLDIAETIYRKMLAAREINQSSFQKEIITDSFTHTGMMSAANKNNNFPLIVEAYQNAIHFKELEHATHYKVMECAAQHGSEELLNEAYRNISSEVGQPNSTTLMKYQKSMTELHKVLAAKHIMPITPEENPPGPIFSGLTSSILSELGKHVNQASMAHPNEEKSSNPSEHVDAPRVESLAHSYHRAEPKGGLVSWENSPLYQKLEESKSHKNVPAQQASLTLPAQKSPPLSSQWNTAVSVKVVPTYAADVLFVHKGRPNASSVSDSSSTSSLLNDGKLGKTL